jgi:hypothetical protein
LLVLLLDLAGLLVGGVDRARPCSRGSAMSSMDTIDTPARVA